MSSQGRGARATAWILIGLSIGPALQARSQTPASRSPRPEVRVTTHAEGTFSVSLRPQSTADSAENLGRMSIDKQFHGDLEGTSRGEMLTAMTSVQGSAGYVAVERVSGTLRGLRGTFVLQHSGTMTHGIQHLVITVVPDSGTDQLLGLAGTMTISIADGVHAYAFDYSLSGAP